MISSLLNHREIGRVCRLVVRFLDVTVSRAMGCFFGCFRIRDDRARISNTTRPNKHTDAVISKNRLSSLFLSEEKEESWSNDIESQRLESPEIDKSLKDEAKFLKACGTLIETPAEIRKASQKLKGSPSFGKDKESSKFHSWLPNTLITKLHLGRECDQPPSPIKLSEEWGRESPSLEHTPSSCISNAQTTGRISISSTDCNVAGNANPEVMVNSNQSGSIASASPWISGTNAQCRNKSVRFEFDSDASSSRDSSSGNISQICRKYESPDNENVSKNSPNPTPLKLSDDMQTPGTVYPTNLKSLADGNTRIRSQYVYSVRNPVESVSQLKALEEEGFDSHELSGELKESIENATPELDTGVEGSSVGKDLKVEASLSAWLKPAASTSDDNSKSTGGSSRKNSHFARNPGDRPIIGMVAAHWIEEETPQIGPKWWDGNGIPNSTNKYKEDQKVSWHATPFEERLEKALSEETFISQRKNIKENPVVFEDTEEADTALSQLRPSSHSKSVVSY